jgi:hypothetical protein
VILEQISFYTELRSLYPKAGDEGSDQSTSQDPGRRGKTSAGIGQRPGEDQEDQTGQTPEKDGRQDYPENTAPTEGVLGPYLSSRSLVDQGGTVKTLALQLSESLARFIPVGEVTYEGA